MIEASEVQGTTADGDVTTANPTAQTTDRAVSYLIVSDFHLSQGRRDFDLRFNELEDFFYDGAFGRFIDYFLDHPPTVNANWELIILGDLIEFMQVTPVDGPDARYDSTTEADCILKLTRVAAGHRRVFEALARWVEAGNRLHIAVGNHDIELARAGVQCQFKREIVASGRPCSDLTLNKMDQLVTFWNWMFYCPGVLYAEHGQQYDELNSFITPLWPFTPEYVRADKKPWKKGFTLTRRNVHAHTPFVQETEHIDIPFGTAFVYRVFNRVEQHDPFSDNVKPLSAYIIRSILRLQVDGIFPTLRFWLRSAYDIMRGVPAMSKSAAKEYRQEYQKSMHCSYAKKLRGYKTSIISDDILAQIDKLAITRKSSSIQMETFKFLLPKIVAVTLLLAVFSLSTVLALLNIMLALKGDEWFWPGSRIAAFVVLSVVVAASFAIAYFAIGKRYPRVSRAIASLIVGLSGFMILLRHGGEHYVDWRSIWTWIVVAALIVIEYALWRRYMPWSDARQRERNLYETAIEIDRILRAHDLGVPVYVFGHTHVIESDWLTDCAPEDSATARATPRYINSGTWTPILRKPTDLLRQRETFLFVRITWSGPSSAVQADLMEWNDQAGRIQRVESQDRRLRKPDRNAREPKSEQQQTLPVAAS